jgi:hypothetical protein
LPVIMPWDDPGGDGGPDAVTVTYMDPALVMDTSNQVIATWDTLTITFKPAFRGNALKLAQLNAGDLLMCSDYADPRGIRSYIWTISAVNTTTGQVGVVPNDGYSDYAQWFTNNPNLTPIMTCSRAEVVTFYVDDDDDGVGAGTIDNPVLMMSADQSWPDNDDVPLVDNIEDLQLGSEVVASDGEVNAAAQFLVELHRLVEILAVSERGGGGLLEFEFAGEEEQAVTNLLGSEATIRASAEQTIFGIGDGAR